MALERLLIRVKDVLISLLLICFAYFLEGLAALGLTRSSTGAMRLRSWSSSLKKTRLTRHMETLHSSPNTPRGTLSGKISGVKESNWGVANKRVNKQSIFSWNPFARSEAVVQKISCDDCPNSQSKLSVNECHCYDQYNQSDLQTMSWDISDHPEPDLHTNRLRRNTKTASTSFVPGLASSALAAGEKDMWVVARY